MAKLEENYLDFVRERLYGKQFNVPIKGNPALLHKSNKSKHRTGNEETPKNTVRDGFKTKKETFKAKAKLQNKLKIKHKPKQVAFIEDTSKNLPESATPTKSRHEVKNRIATPYKIIELPSKLQIKSKSPNLSNSQVCKIVSTGIKKQSPSLKQNNNPTSEPLRSNLSSDTKELSKNNDNAKSKKRLHSDSDSPEVNVKRKKDKSIAKKGKKLTFDDSSNDSEIVQVSSVNVSQKSKIFSEKKKVKNKSVNKSLDLNFTVDTYWGGEAKVDSRNTGDRFICSVNKEVRDENSKKRLKNKVGKSDKNKINDKNQQNLEYVLESPKRANEKSVPKNKKQNKRVNKSKLKRNGLMSINSNKSVTKVLLSSSSSESLSDVEFMPRQRFKKSSNVVIDSVEISDSGDDTTVGVKGLKYQIFCNSFPPTHNEQFLGQTDVLRIPRKHFKISEKDIESDNSLASNEDSISEPKLSPHLDSSNNQTKEKKKIKILDVQILSNGLQDTNGISRDQWTAEEELYSQKENKIESAAKEMDYNFDKGAQDIAEKLSKPLIMTLKNGNKIVALNFGDKIHFHGLCLIKVLNGDIEILGANINPTSEERKLYSPRGSALLYVRNKCTLFADSLVKLKDLVPEELLLENDAQLTFQEHFAIFLCSQLREPYVDFIERYIAQKIFPEDNLQGLRIDFKLHGNWNKIQSSETWEEVLENILEDSKTAICGGKGVGKSTFLRYAVNYLLKRFTKLRVIDLDPGQSEFYAPGCISVVTVNKEVLGPNYSHLAVPDSAILSHINMSHDIKKYLKSVRCLLDSIKSMEVLPTLINFPGFTQGIGLNITAESLKLIEPNMVIQIDSKTQSRNYKVDLTCANVTKILEKNVLKQDEINGNVNLSYNFVKFDSLAESNEAWSLEARQGREMNILSYFGKLMTDSITDFTSTDVNMYSISISALSITNSEGKAISPVAINAALVALCSKLDRHSNIFSCLGYGIVRGIDLQSDTLVLITPETGQTLENVSHLVLSSVTTPPSLIMTASNIKGHIPYVSIGDLVDFGQFTKRSYLPPRK